MSFKQTLSKKDYKTLLLSSFGGCLEFYDFIIFVFFTGVLSRLFFPQDSEFIGQMKTLGIFAAGYLARPLGGVIIAHFGDKLGRKRMFAFSIFMMALPTLVIGCLPSYADIGILAPILLLLCRIFQGAAVGGQVPGVWVFIAEHMPSSSYGFGMGMVNAGITAGILIGLLIALGLNSLDYAHAWRIAFIIGGLFGLITVYLRRFLEETPVFEEIKKLRLQEKSFPLKTVLIKYKKSCLIVAALTFAHASTAGVLILMTPGLVFEHALGLSRSLSLEASCLASATFTLGFVFWGVMYDKLGLIATSLLAWGVLLVCVYAFYFNLSSDISPSTLILAYSFLGFFAAAIVMTPIITTRLFPPVVRFSGLAFAYNLSYALFGGFVPIILAAWLKLTSMAPAYFVSLAALACIGVLPFCKIKEEI